MNHPLGKFHRPRFAAGLHDAARGQTLAHRLPAGVRLGGQATFAEALPSVPRRKKTAPPRRAEARPTNVVPPPPSEKPRLRWYQYSLRTLLLLTLIVSLFMSWYAAKMKHSMAQKKAVEAILAADGTVEYDYQFDEQGKEIKGAQGHGPAWLRELLGPDYFDTVVHAYVGSVKGMEAVNGLVRLRSLSIDVPEDGEDPLKHLQDIAGLKELEISGYVTDAGLENVQGLRYLKRLKLSWQGPGDDPKRPKQLAGFGLVALQSCPIEVDPVLCTRERAVSVKG